MLSINKITIQEILNIQDPENFYVKLDKIDQFGIDTKSLYINDKEKLLQEMAFHHDTNRPTENATYNYVMDRAYTLHFIPYDEKNKLWLYVGAYMLVPITKQGLITSNMRVIQPHITKFN